ncbi:MAG: type II/IV secretion system ATPase subunit [Candidatus Diapherotrites archaeon]|nr:type II/IV secretion system ATPase subunit [Candidatus Diapherotrites archaeon]
MKIGGFKVGKYVVKREANNFYLIFDCKSCIYKSSLADDEACRLHLMTVLQKTNPNIIVLSEVYDKIYNEEQTEMFKEIVKIMQKFAAENIWGYTNLGDVTNKAEERRIGMRHRVVVSITKDLIARDPIKAYLLCLSEIKKETERYKEGDEQYRKGSKIYLKTLLKIKKSFEECRMIENVKKFISELTEMPDTKEIYKSLFEAQIKPSFIGSRLLLGEESGLELLDEYTVKNTGVQIFSHPDRAQNLYFIYPPEYSLSPEKYFVISKTKEIVSEYSPSKAALSSITSSRAYFERLYETTIMEVADHYNIKLNKKELKELSEIVARYTVGYGILEILLSDRRITDIYIDSPIGQHPIYIVHSDFGQCITNVLYTEREALTLATKLRAMSGRPFDEAHPVLDYDLPDLETRVATIGPPLAPDGVAFAFRLHKLTPWTLPQFIDVKFLNPLAAGLISFLIDNQATLLVTGSRGSGKTSFLTACILEIPKNIRIIVQEDTLEIPVPYIKKIGFNIQRLKTKSPITASKTETEMEPEEALRTALRLGDSALVLGEVRSKEAITLYEAMRVGAAGNVVMGTIHGDSAYSVWDRVVNDLGVPTTSFKATDVVVTARPIRFYGSLRRQRRLVQVTEIRKHWNEEPLREGGLLDLMLYEAKKDDLIFIEDSLKDSELFSKIQKTSGLSIREIWSEIKVRAESKKYLVELKKKHSLPELLEAENSAAAHSKLLLLKEKQIKEFGKVDYEKWLQEWKAWVDSVLLKNLISEKKGSHATKKE